MRNLKRLIPIFGVMFVMIILFVVQAIAQVPAAPPAPAPSVWDWITTNKSTVALLLYGVLDFVVLLVPSLSGYGIVHQIIIMLARMAGIPVPPQ